MDNVIFALGPNCSYFFNGPSRWDSRGLPNEVGSIIKATGSADSLCATFGGDKDNYFFWRLKDSSKDLRCFWGDNVPPDFKSWLLDDDGKKPKHDLANMKVCLGPGKSFVAWTPDSIRWADIPRDLEKILQSWLTPAGWKSGPPRLIALGANGAYFAASEYGWWQYHLGSSWAGTIKVFRAFKASEQFRFDDIEYMCLDPTTADCFTVVFKNTYIKCNLRDPIELEKFRQQADSFASQQIKEFYEKERAEEQKRAEEEKKRAAAEEAKAKAAEEAKKREEERAKRAAEEAARRAAEEERQAEMEFQYAIWLSTCERAFSSPQPLRVFPQPPEGVCVCKLTACTIRKTYSRLDGCKHDFETILKASGSYSKAWLRSQRNAWHPDHFGRKCEVSCRKEMQRQAQEVFTIFGELIDAM